MSPVRTHFWTDVARGYGAGASPRKYGLNCTLPALTNSGVGSSRISDALDTGVWPARTKWSVKRRTISWVCTVMPSRVSPGRQGGNGTAGDGYATRRAPAGGVRPLPRALGHGRPARARRPARWGPAV